MSQEQDEIDRLRDELATAREVIQESMEARRVTEAEGGSLNQANNEIDRLRARVAELEKQPHANELRALRDLFAAAGRTIHTASSGGRATLEEINDAWAEVCAAKVVNRDLPAPDVTPDAWMVETRGGNLIYWITADRALADQFAATYDREAIPLYRRPPANAPAPDVVTVPREEWEAVNEFADMIVPLRDNLAGISWTGKLVDVFAAYDRWYAVRIHADQAPDALRSGEAGKNTTTNGAENG